MVTGGYHAIRDKPIGRLDDTVPGRVQILTGSRQLGEIFSCWKQSRAIFKFWKKLIWHAQFANVQVQNSGEKGSRDQDQGLYQLRPRRAVGVLTKVAGVQADGHLR